MTDDRDDPPPKLPPRPSLDEALDARRRRRRDAAGGEVLDARRTMIRETNAFLSWALREDRGLPRIPRRRADGAGGGFGRALMHRPQARAVARHFWVRTLARLGGGG